MQQPNPYYQNLQAFLHRGFMLDIISPPSEPAFRQSRECIVEPIKKRFAFPVVIGFIGMENTMSIERQKAYIRANSNHGVCFIHSEQKEESNDEWIDRAKFKMSNHLLDTNIIPQMQVNPISMPNPKDEKKHRQVIEKRRRKR